MNKEVVDKLRRILGPASSSKTRPNCLSMSATRLPLFKHRPDVVVFRETRRNRSLQVVKLANEYSHSVSSAWCGNRPERRRDGRRRRHRH